MPSPVSNAELYRYLEAMDNARIDRALAVLSAMTQRERYLVKEIAVMANVLALPPGKKPLRDKAVLVATIIHCLTMPDLYPTIARLERVADQRKRRAKNA